MGYVDEGFIKNTKSSVDLEKFYYINDKDFSEYFYHWECVLGIIDEWLVSLR
jgi:hypothetical protein